MVTQGTVEDPDTSLTLEKFGKLAAAVLATYNTWSHLTKRKTHVYLGQNKTTFILNLLSLVVKLDKGQGSVF